MHRKLQLILCAAAGALALSAQAAMPGPAITNGGTGFIGVTDSARTGAPATAPLQTAMAGDASRSPMQAGEASTMVDGQPNANPDAPRAGRAMARPMASTSGRTTMGAMRAQPNWGTPD